MRIVAAVSRGRAEKRIRFLRLHCVPRHRKAPARISTLPSDPLAIPKRHPAFQTVNFREIHAPGPPALTHQPEALRQKHQQQACRQHLRPAKSFGSKESGHGEPASVLPWRGTNRETSADGRTKRTARPGELEEVSPALTPPGIASGSGFELTKLSPLEERMQQIFIGRDGLRPIWRLVLYLLMYRGLRFCLFVMLAYGLAGRALPMATDGRGAWARDHRVGSGATDDADRRPRLRLLRPSAGQILWQAFLGGRDCGE